MSNLSHLMTIGLVIDPCSLMPALAQTSAPPGQAVPPRTVPNRRTQVQPDRYVQTPP
jgi:hypothetical protein